MYSLNKKEAFMLFFGDIVIFFLSLWIALFVRFGQIPTTETFNDHLVPFIILFIVWVIIFYIAGLYEKHTTILKNKLPGVILQTQIFNAVISVIFFYFIPIFGITPKTILFIYLITSFILVSFWRIYGYGLIGKREKQNSILIGGGEEMKELFEEVNSNSRYNLNFISSLEIDSVDKIDFQEEILNRVYEDNVSIIAIDLENEKVSPILPHLYNLIFSKIKFIDMHKIYEDIFDRVPLSLLRYNWFIENISSHPKVAYDFSKRLMDLIVSFVFGIISLVLYPFIILAIKIEDGGPAFIVQDRVGKNNKKIKILKFRSMKVNDGGKWIEEGDSRHTKVGKFLRKTRIDELPQLWNVLKGDISLIGPRPDILNLGLELAKEIPYYNIRNIIKPGLSGWAQIKQEKPPQSIPETKMRLAYD
ncbi:sugar transferase, partial [Candidatus Nomurabacteria bacterium]|nr:sugar transferase [Candidatus Nomurabacteria bacterium]